MTDVIMSVLALAAAQSAAPPAPAQALDGTAVQAPADQNICRRIETTGTILAKRRVCGTRADWAKLDKTLAERTERDLEERRRSPSSLGEIN